MMELLRHQDTHLKLQVGSFEEGFPDKQACSYGSVDVKFDSIYVTDPPFDFDMVAFTFNVANCENQAMAAVIIVFGSLFWLMLVILIGFTIYILTRKPKDDFADADDDVNMPPSVDGTESLDFDEVGMPFDEH
eukprot:gnl/Chilomastix_caulleri/2492.p1 GENE.gnl/Chilomastix_caulleri/2492~~gnl/Chilomastix_caulleri/2492.p1  ORF type:complete len:133 (+),score=33.69 gnl/Chilomastix_caulleri/2492:375-773(+)